MLPIVLNLTLAEANCFMCNIYIYIYEIYRFSVNAKQYYWFIYHSLISASHHPQILVSVDEYLSDEVYPRWSSYTAPNNWYQPATSGPDLASQGCERAKQ